MLVSTLLSVSTLGATLVAGVPTIEVIDSRFVNTETKNEFQIVGIAYQIGGSSGYDPAKKQDPLSDPSVCMRDAALMQSMGINTIRVYNLDPNLNHDACASIFNAAGIYMILDVNAPSLGDALDRNDPQGSYTASYLNRTFAVVEAFKDYDNTMAFFSGNEIMSNPSQCEEAPAYIRAVTRDIKNYISKQSSRKIPVGYSAADVRDILPDTYHYLTCKIEGETDDSSIGDLFALNSYSWCGESSFERAGYDELVNIFHDTAVPVFFSEYGCNEVLPRDFSEVPAIYGPQMIPPFSGGVLYEYAQEPNNYGLVECSLDENRASKLLPGFNALKSQFSKLNMAKLQGTKFPSTNSTSTPKTCSKSLLSQARFQDTWDLPPTPSGALDIIKKGVHPKPSGKFVSLTDYHVKLPVNDQNGNRLTNLAVIPGSKNLGVNSTFATADGNRNASHTAASPAATSSASSQSQSPVAGRAAGFLPWSTAGIAGCMAVFAVLM